MSLGNNKNANKRDAGWWIKVEDGGDGRIVTGSSVPEVKRLSL